MSSATEVIRPVQLVLKCVLQQLINESVKHMNQSMSSTYQCLILLIHPSKHCSHEWTVRKLWQYVHRYAVLLATDTFVIHSRHYHYRFLRTILRFHPCFHCTRSHQVHKHRATFIQWTAIRRFRPQFADCEMSFRVTSLLLMLSRRLCSKHFAYRSPSWRIIANAVISINKGKNAQSRGTWWHGYTSGTDTVSL